VTLRGLALALGLASGFSASGAEGAALGPELGGVRLGMTPAEARAALLGRAGVSFDDVRRYDEQLRQAHAMGSQEAVRRKFFPVDAWNKAHPGMSYRESRRYIEPTACQALRSGQLPQGIKPPTDCPRPEIESAILVDVDPSRHEFFSVINEQHREDAYSTSTSLSFSISRKPGPQQVEHFRLQHQYRQLGGYPTVERRPQMRTVMESLVDKLGPPAFCSPPPPPNRRRGFPEFCTWSIGGSGKVAVPRSVEPAFVHLECGLEDRNNPKIELYAGFSMQQYWSGEEPSEAKRLTLDRVAVCGDALVTVRDVTPDPKHADRAVDALDLRASWIRKRMESNEEAARMRDEMEESYRKAVRELSKGNKPRL
jgi:hypothetical protein